MTRVDEAAATDTVRPPTHPNRPRRPSAVRALIGGKRRFGLIAYGVPVLVAALATGTWFSPGRFIAAGDVAPFEFANLASETGSLWNHQTVGTGSASYSICRLFVVLVAWSFRAVGLGAPVAEYAFYAAFAAFAAFGGAYLAAVWVRRPGPVALAGLFAAFNAYLMINEPLPLPALAIGLTGLLTGLLLRAAGGARVRARTLALATLPASVLADNPPLLVVCAITVLAAVAGAPLLVGPGAGRRAGRLLLRAAPLCVLVNLWWLVPYAITLGATPGLRVSVSTDLTGWAWTQVRASVANVATLNSTWAWTHLNYFPYRPTIEAYGWSVLRWALPALAAMGVFTAGRERRRPAWALAGACVVLIVVGTGQHPPFGPLNLWLLSHVPGGWLLRDPAMKTAVPQVLGYVVLGALAADRLLRRPARSDRIDGRVALAALTAAALVAVWPLWTGAVIPRDRTPLPGMRVAVPADWYRLAAAADATGTGKVLVLPLDPYYQITTDWGYHGVDAIPAQLLTRPVVQTLPDGYFMPAGGADALTTGVQTALLTGDDATALRGLAALGIGQVVVRRDLAAPADAAATVDAAAPEDAAALLAAADRVLTRVASYPVGNLYRVPGVAAPVVGYGRVASIVDADRADRWSALPNLRPYTVATDAPGIATDEVVWRPGGPKSFSVASPGRYRLAPTETAPVFRATVVSRAGTPVLRLTNVVHVAVDGTALPPPPRIDLPIGGEADAIAVNGWIGPLVPGGQLIQITSTSQISLYTATGDQPAARFSTTAGCAGTHGGPAPAAGKPTVIRLGGDARSACAAVSPGPGRAYRVRFQSRRVSGRPARFCLWQTRLRTCAALPAPAGGKGWQSYQGVVQVPADSGPLVLYLYGDADGGGRPTLVDYRDVHADVLHRVSVARRALAGRPAIYRTLAAGPHTVVFQARIASDLGAPDALGDCNNLGRQAPADLGIRMRRQAGGLIGLIAPVDIACTRLAARQPLASRYDLELEYRTLAGRTARICVWEVGPDHCVPLPALARTTAWSRLSTSVRPEAAATALLVYMYADGQSTPETSVQYRAVSLTLDPGFALYTSPATAAPAGPALSVREAGPARFGVSVTGATGAFALVLTEAAASGWRLRGLPAGWTARPFTAVGYAQAWLVIGTGDARLEIDYGPGRYTDAAITVSVAAIGTLLVTLVWGLWWRRPWWRRRQRPG